MPRKVLPSTVQQRALDELCAGEATARLAVLGNSTVKSREVAQLRRRSASKGFAVYSTVKCLGLARAVCGCSNCKASSAW